MPKLALINPNSNAETTAMMVSIAQEAGGGANVAGFTATRAPRLIDDPLALAASAAEVVEMGRALHGFDAVIVAAFGDPGAEELAQSIAVPVVGIGAAAAHRASRQGMAFAVATTTADLAASIDGLMRLHAGNAPYIGTFVTPGHDAATLMSRVEDLDHALLAQIERAVGAGAKRVIIGGGPLGAAAERLSLRTTVPLIHPIKEAVRACLTLIEPIGEGNK